MKDEGSLKHINWFNDTGEEISTVDGITVKVIQFVHQDDEKVMSAWAKHFRNHYCNDDEIDGLIEGTGNSKSEYLSLNKFPSSTPSKKLVL